MIPLSGFSKLTKNQKIDLLVENLFDGDSEELKEVKGKIKSFWHGNVEEQKILDEFSENTITNYYFPYGVIPNLKINEKLYTVPMVIEESSVIAAASSAAKFWLERGGVQAEVLSMEKVGQVHFEWSGEPVKLFNFFDEIKSELSEEVAPILANMVARGGGLLDISLLDKTDLADNLYQIKATFDTRDAMGANLINTVLEVLGSSLKRRVNEYANFDSSEQEINVIMAILSNYTPECRVRVSVSCAIEDLGEFSEMSSSQFAKKFYNAVQIAKLDPFRATTHNKGIFNGIDAVVLATGNDFRAVEACGHAYASRDGQYRGLSDVLLEDDQFKFFMEIPLSLGTVGGLTTLHPLAKMSLDMLGRPSAKDLMKIAASVGLVQNFAAVKSLVTSGIQKGHMKMHLMNIMNHLGVSKDEQVKVKEYFYKRTVSFSAVAEYVNSIRIYH